MNKNYSNLPREHGRGHYYEYVNSIGSVLELLRIWRGYSQNDVAKKLDFNLDTDKIDEQYISKVEKGKKGISLDRLIVWCEVLQLQPSRVFQYAEFFLERQGLPEDQIIKEALDEIEKELRNREMNDDEI